jgi:hypothetical protein
MSQLPALVAVALAATLGGCDDQPQPTSAPPETNAGSGSEEAPPPPRDPLVQPVRCPSQLDNCRSAYGSIVYVERVDPDGDGDAHFVLASRQSVTAPGISVIDVRRDLRPRPLPALGDEISAAGPVFPGSYGQRQIEAIKLRVAP